jgi:hypothetical protein
MRMWMDRRSNEGRLEREGKSTIKISENKIKSRRARSEVEVALHRGMRWRQM